MKEKKKLMPRYDDYSVVYHLVGEQPIPVFLCALQFPKETRHYLLSTQADKTKKPMKNVYNRLKERGITNVECIFLGEEKIANNFVSLREVLQKIIPQEARGVCLDITGGTKPMAFVTLQIAQERHIQAIYLDTQTPGLRYCWWLGDSVCKSDFDNLLNLADFVRLAGLKAEIKPPDKLPSEEYLAFLYESKAILEKHINALKLKDDELTVKKEKAVQSGEQSQKQAGQSYHDSILDAFQCFLNDVHQDPEMNTEKWERFLQDEFMRTLELDKKIRFITGIWFEYFVYQKLKHHVEEQGLREIAMNMKAEKLQQSQQEFDVVYTDGYSFVIVECKTEPKMVQGFTMTLTSLRHEYSGALGRAALVSAWSQQEKPISDIMKGRIENNREYSLFCGESGVEKLASNMLSFPTGRIME